MSSFPPENLCFSSFLYQFCSSQSSQNGSQAPVLWLQRVPTYRPPPAVSWQAPKLSAESLGKRYQWLETLHDCYKDALDDDLITWIMPDPLAVHLTGKRPWELAAKLARDALKYFSFLYSKSEQKCITSGFRWQVYRWHGPPLL